MWKRKIWIILIVLSGLAFSCRKLEEEPYVKTGMASNITSHSALITGTIIDAGQGIDEYGFCWSLNQNPTINNDRNIIGRADKTDEYSAIITTLDADSFYFLRAYAVSGNIEVYGEAISFTTDPEVVTDASGNIYNVIRIGSQLWTKENLRTTKFKDNSNIQLVADNATWGNLSTAGFCWYNNDASTYGSTYGAIYNWYAVSTGKLCPVGWHVPTDPEWTTLIYYLGGFSVAGGKLKEQGTTHWNYPNTGATNSSSFSGLPGGYRRADGIYVRLGEVADFWSQNDNSISNAWDYGFDSTYEKINRDNDPKTGGFSIRCIKD